MAGLSTGSTGLWSGLPSLLYTTGLTTSVGLNADTFSPITLFSAGQQGAWYDPSDFLPNWRRNLLTYTEQFDDAYWTKSNSAISANAAAAPDGTVTADLLYPSTSGSDRRVIRTLALTSGSNYAVSVYAKAAGKNFIYLLVPKANTINDVVWFNVANGTVGTVGSAAVSATITPSGNGFFRCTVVGPADGADVFAVNVADADNSTNVTSSGTNGVLIWGAQLELGSTATSYQQIVTPEISYLTYQPQPVMYQDSAGTTPVTAVEQPVGLLKDKSGRGNHALQATSASRPVLSSRVNLLTYSEQFDNAAWVKDRVTVTANAIAAPDGTATADKVLDTAAGSNTYRIYNSLTLSATSYTQTVYAKAAELSWCYIRIGNALRAWFDLANGVVGTVNSGLTANIQSVGNGWYRLTVTIATATAGAGFGLVGLTTGNNVEVYTATGGNGIYVWGADLRVSNDGVGIPTYQRIAAATDYDTVGFPLYLRFDGTDDSLTTSSINFTSTDKMTVWAGTRSLVEAAGTQVIVELSSAFASNAGAFVLAKANTPTTFLFRSRGSAVPANILYAAATPSPVTVILTGTGNIPAPLTTLRNNSAQVDLTDSQGTGTFGNYPLYIGVRGGSSFYYNGRLYGLIVRGAQSTPAQITAAEIWMNQRTRAY